jgi:hypothetical protein
MEDTKILRFIKQESFEPHEMMKERILYLLKQQHLRFKIHLLIREAYTDITRQGKQ